MFTIYTDNYTRNTHDNQTQHSAFLLYNGAPNPDDDPADYEIPLKGVRIA